MLTLHANFNIQVQPQSNLVTITIVIHPKAKPWTWCQIQSLISTICTHSVIPKSQMFHLSLTAIVFILLHCLSMLMIEKSVYIFIFISSSCACTSSIDDLPLQVSDDFIISSVTPLFFISWIHVHNLKVKWKDLKRIFLYMFFTQFKSFMPVTIKCNLIIIYSRH